MADHLLCQIAARKDLTQTDLRVFLFLNSRLDFETLTPVPHTDIVDVLNTSKSDASRSVKKLVDLGIVLRGPKIGTTHTYRLNKKADLAV